MSAKHRATRHGSAAAWAGLGEAWPLIGIVGGFGLVLWCRRVEQLACAGEVLGTSAIGKEPVMPNAVEPRWQDVDEESADELAWRQGHGRPRIAGFGPVVLAFECHPFVVEGDETAV